MLRDSTADGRLQQIDDPEQGVLTLAFAKRASGHKVTLTTAENKVWMLPGNLAVLSVAAVATTRSHRPPAPMHQEQTEDYENQQQNR